MESNKRNRILIRGSINSDEVFAVERIVKPGQTISSTSFSRFAGGKSANAAIAVANAGASVTLQGHVGYDGTWLKELISKSGVDTAAILLDPDLPQGRAIIQVDTNGENSIILMNGSNYSNLPLPSLDLSLYSHLIIQNEIQIKDTIAALRSASAANLTTIFNPSPIPSPRELESFPFTLVNYLIVNEGELKDLLGVKFKTIEELIESLSKDAVLIVTKGENGSTTHRKGGNVVNCDAEACSVIDSTGAGDCFLGYFVASLANSPNSSEEERLRFASVAAAMCCEVAGPQSPLCPDVEGRRERSESRKGRIEEH